LVHVKLNKTLAQKEVESTIQRTENLISYYTLRKETFDPVLAELEAKLQVLNVSLDMSCIDVSVSGGKPELNTVFGILRKFEFTPDDRPDEKVKASFNTYFRHTTGAVIWFSFSSTLCKRVQVGTKMVEQPIYEVQCE